MRTLRSLLGRKPQTPQYVDVSGTILRVEHVAAIVPREETVIVYLLGGHSVSFSGQDAAAVQKFFGGTP